MDTCTSSYNFNFSPLRVGSSRQGMHCQHIDTRTYNTLTLGVFHQVLGHILDPTPKPPIPSTHALVNTKVRGCKVPLGSCPGICLSELTRVWKAHGGHKAAARMPRSHLPHCGVRCRVAVCAHHKGDAKLLAMRPFSGISRRRTPAHTTPHASFSSFGRLFWVWTFQCTSTRLHQQLGPVATATAALQSGAGWCQQHRGDKMIAGWPYADLWWDHSLPLTRRTPAQLLVLRSLVGP
jgi:hypothetical protein